MTVLVTGGAGYIGSHMVHALLDRGEPAVALDNLATGRRAAVPAEARLFTGDAGDVGLVSALLDAYDVDAVAHFAASTLVPESVADPLAYYRNNAAATCSLLQAAVARGVPHVILSSTCAVYGNPDRNPVDEAAPTAPTSPYGASKLAAEMMLRDAAAAHGLRYVILRYFNVAGADPQLRTGEWSAHATHLIKVGAQAALGLRPFLEIYGDDYPTPDGTCIRDYIHVQDLVQAHLAALDHLRAGGPSLTLNCGYGRGYSVREVVEALKRVSGVDFAVRRAARRPGDPAAVIAAAGRIREVLGWTPARDDLDLIVADALAWERKLLAQSSEA